MTRTFHQKITPGAVCGTILLLGLSVYAFWTQAVILGVLMALGMVLVAERTLHTEYTFSDGMLIINKGRLAKGKTIPVGSITSCRLMKTVLGSVRFLLLTYGDGQQVQAVQPDNERDFVKVLQKEILRVRKQREKGDKNINEDTEDED